MKILQLEKPIIGKETGLMKAYKQFLLDTHLPINEWANRNNK